MLVAAHADLNRVVSLIHDEGYVMPRRTGDTREREPCVERDIELTVMSQKLASLIKTAGSSGVSTGVTFSPPKSSQSNEESTSSTITKFGTPRKPIPPAPAILPQPAPNQLPSPPPPFNDTVLNDPTTPKETVYESISLESGRSEIPSLKDTQRAVPTASANTGPSANSAIYVSPSRINTTSDAINAQKCTLCGETVAHASPEELVAVNRVWHSNCFRCGGTGGKGCKQKLTLLTYLSHENNPYCASCHAALLRPGISNCVRM